VPERKLYSFRSAGLRHFHRQAGEIANFLLNLFFINSKFETNTNVPNPKFKTNDIFEDLDKYCVTICKVLVI
jgi:hypothetical protein